MTPYSMNARDAGLRLIGRINRWLITGAVALTAMIALVTQHAFRAAHPAATPASSSASSAVPSQPSGGDDGSASGSGLQQPTQVPTPAPAASSAPVVSGGS
jgi:hypothetical protein